MSAEQQKEDVLNSYDWNELVDEAVRRRNLFLPVIVVACLIMMISQALFSVIDKTWYTGILALVFSAGIYLVMDVNRCKRLAQWQQQCDQKN